MKEFDAPCAGKPELFDADNWTDSTMGLEYCRKCPFRLQCLDLVDPAANWYEGVVGGMLWVNGKPMLKEWRKMNADTRPFADPETTIYYMKRYE